MKRNLLLVFMTIFTFMSLLSSNVTYGQATLKHSYTFEEGTYEGTIIYDQTGSLNGTMTGDAISIAEGKCVVSGATTNTDGYVVFDGVTLDLASYNAVTLEAFIETGEILNTTYTMFAYFGATAQGTNCFWIQPTRAGTETRIEANNGSNTITALLNEYEVDDGKKHHLVAILSSDALTYYLDGVVIAETSTEGADYISTIGTDIAQLFKGPDGWADPNYNCWLEEFNIYDGVLDASIIGQRAGIYLGLDLYNASLDTITLDVGAMDPTFTSENDLYEVTVPYGTTSVKIAAAPSVGGATIEMFNGLGVKLVNGVLTFNKEDGDFAEIVVTALDGVTKQSYYLDVFPEAGEAAATLANIELSAGSLTTAFDMNTTSYVAIVPAGSTTVDLTGVPNWNAATVAGDGTITLTDGMATATITVTSEDATASIEYTVEIYTSIVNISTEYYLVHEANGFVATESGDTVFNALVLAEAVVDSAAQIWHFEESGEDGQYYIKNKDGNYICLSRTSINAYDVEVYADLPSFDLDSARFVINEFEPGKIKIMSVARMNVSATANMLSPNNGLLGSVVFNDKSPGSGWDLSGYTIWTLKLATDKTIASPYDLHLADLTINGIPLGPDFDPVYTNYHATIPVGVNSVEITATPRDETAIVTGTGTIDVSGGEGTITIVVTAAADAQYTREYVINYSGLGLTHSFTFEDGTFDGNTVFDQVGSVNGTIGGDSITIADGKATVSGATANNHGWISMDGAALALNTYSEITIEVMLEAGNQENLSFTMLTYFGTSTPGNGCLWIQPSRSGNESRVETNNRSTSKTAAYPGYEIDDGLKHHVVAVLSKSALKYYLDGELVAENSTDDVDFISTLGTDVANIFRGVNGWNDPNYNGSIYEYNIYEGEMDEVTIAERTSEFLGDASRDATLSSLTVDAGALIPAFDPEITSYSVVVPVGTETVTVTAVPNDENATAVGDTAVNVSSGSGSTAVVVTSEFGSTLTYNIGFSTPEEFTLMHSYPFDDGTAIDVVGDADGTVVSGSIANGAYTSATDSDYVELPAATIAINNYSAITLEAYIFADVDNTGATMMAYFGGNENAVGGNGFYLTPDRWSESRTGISCGNITEPWNAEQGVTGSPVAVGEKHHVVSVLTDSSIKMYIDGLLVGEAEVSGDNSIFALSTVNAWLCKGGYDVDPSWMGTIDEFNIYNGAMDAATIATHASMYLSDLTLMHSYTFEDGTAADVIGTADGTLMGAGTIADGAYTAAANGDYIVLPAADIAINTYTAITLEGYIYTDVDNTAAVMMAYFGGNENGLGGNGYFLTPDRWSESRTAISCGNVTAPWEAEQGVTGAPVSVGEKHHIVSVLTESTIAWYIDGVLVGETEVTGDNTIANISTVNAWLCRGGYDGDPSWMGTIDEFNIYNGAMDAASIAERAQEYLSASDANLSALTTDVGVLGPQFNSNLTSYYLTVPDGTTSVDITAATSNANATVVGDGVVDVSSGSGTIAVVVTSADATTTKTYYIVFSTPGILTKMHSYTFNDGTAADVVGNADGTLVGTGTIANGKYTSNADGNYIELPAATIAINTYSAITLEAYVTTGVNDGWTMLAYFGSNGGWPSYWMSIARADDQSMTTVDAGAGAFSTAGAEPGAGETHHYVSVLTDSTITWYIDGVMASAATIPESTTISGITTDIAYICKGGYPDPTWMGDIHEFNIYEGEMDAITVAQRAEDLPTAAPVVKDDASIKVYPTYSTGDFKVETNGSRGMITVYNLTGKLVLQKQIESNLEIVTVRDGGMYIMRVENEETKRTFKVFKTK